MEKTKFSKLTRVLCMVLCVIMIAGLMPITTFASETETLPEETSIVNPQVVEASQSQNGEPEPQQILIYSRAKYGKCDIN